MPGFIAKLATWSLILMAFVGAQARAQELQMIEVSMAAPDMVRVELRDPDFVRGTIITLEAPRAEAQGSWVDYQGQKGLVIGPRRDHLRLADTPPTMYLDRALADDARGYGPIGGRRVVAVYRKSMPYSSGVFPAANGDTRAGASMRHDLYLQLDGPLPQGSHEIVWPKAILAPTPFVFDDRTSRASSIHATQNGHRRGDLGKSAFLSLWVPGAANNGAVDFRSYGFEQFEIIDKAGKTVFSAPIRLRADPISPEPGSGLPGELIDYVNVSAPLVALSGIAGQTLTTVEPHGFVPGQRVALQRLGGEQDATAVFATVSKTTSTSFTIDAIEGALPERMGPGATAVATHSANRAGTFVFELDYGAWQPVDGSYRLRIAGLGVSDPIIIADTVWQTAAQNALAGLYNHRSGVALDGRFGYERPVAFRPGPDLTIYRSRLPLSWSSEMEGSFVPFAEGAKPGWITDVAAPTSYWGGYMDAGDWDRRIQHVDVAAMLLDAFETTPTEKLFDTGLPKSGEALDAALYRDTDALPDLVHEAIWGLDFFRRLQAADGAIAGGIESAGHPLKGEPSFLEHQSVFVYAPDHLSSFRYAAVAAKLSRILRALGSDDLARIYGDSAIAAWQAGERGFADPDLFYADAIAAGTAAGVFDAVSWDERKTTLQRTATQYRAVAAAALFRLTGEPNYRGVFEARWNASPQIWGYQGDGAWDYLRSGQADPLIAEAITKRFIEEARLVVEAQAPLAYPSLKHPDAPAGWGQGGVPGYHELNVLTRAHQISQDPAILQALEQGYHTLLGANQLGLSLVTGGGVRNVNNVLHEDSIAMGVAPPSGIAIYGWGPQAASAFGWIFGPPWSALPEVGTDEFAQQRRIAPSRFALPYFEYLVEHPALPMQQEYTVHQSIGVMAALALYINAQQR